MRGSSLVEIVIVTGVMGLVLTAIVAGLTLSLKTNAEAEYRAQAVKRSQNAMEVFRRERTVRGWDTFLASFTDGATYCLAELPEPSAEFVSGECEDGQSIVVSGIDFYREATIDIDTTTPSDPQVRVQINTTWDSGGGERNVELVQVFRQFN